MIIQEIISIAVERFDAARAQQLINQWSEEGPKTDWTVVSLQERVGLRIFERFEIKWRGDGAGVRISARNRMDYPMVIDARNALDAKTMLAIGFAYQGMGRGALASRMGIPDA